MKRIYTEMEKEKKKGGRPKAKIDPKQVIKLAQLQCTYEEVAAFFDVNKSTISRSYATEMDKGREIGKMSLRRNQFNLTKTNATMCIWLGKQYLGQREPANNIIESEIEIPTNVDELTDQQANELYEKLTVKKC